MRTSSLFEDLTRGFEASTYLYQLTIVYLGSIPLSNSGGSVLLPLVYVE